LYLQSRSLHALHYHIVVRPASLTGLVLSLALAAVPRAAWYRTHVPDLPPDGFGYLNAARQLRGLTQPDEWDVKSFLPADNKGARAPGYPLFLNLVFAAAGHSPSPEAAVAGARHQHVPPAPRHIERLTTDENVRAVHAAQLALGVAAAGFAYGTLLVWTGSALMSLAGSLIAIGWNPIWIVMFEPSVLAEVLAAFLLTATMWLVSRFAASAPVDTLISLVCGFNVLVRPAMLFAAVPILIFLAWRQQWRRRRAVLVFAPAALIVGSLVIVNGLRYGYWGPSSVAAPALFSHAVKHPEAVREPIGSRLQKYAGNGAAGFIISHEIAVDEGVSYAAATQAIQGAVLQFIVDHPRFYLESVATQFLDFWTPSIQLFPGDLNIVRTHSRWAWRAIVAVEALLLYGSLAIFALRVHPATTLATAVFILCSIGTAATVSHEGSRLAMPAEPLAMMAGLVAVAQIHPRHRYSRIAAYS
jgi:hypothetical protein